MKAKGIKAMMAALEGKGVHVCGTTDQFYGSKNDNNGIWVAADSNPELFDYYNSEWLDTFGVNPSINKLVEDNGWYFEWYDPGTMMVWKN
jgi:hypothetical protein